MTGTYSCFLVLELCCAQCLELNEKVLPVRRTNPWGHPDCFAFDWVDITFDGGGGDDEKTKMM